MYRTTKATFKTLYLRQNLSYCCLSNWKFIGDIDLFTMEHPLFKKQCLQYAISFWTLDLEESITEDILKRSSWRKKMSNGTLTVFRTLQTSDSWEQHTKNFTKKILITHVILDGNWMLTTRWKPWTLFLGTLETLPKAIGWKICRFFWFIQHTWMYTKTLWSNVIKMHG